MFKASFNEREIKEKLSALKELDDNVYGHLLNKIEFNKIQRLKKMSRQTIKRYLAGGIGGYKKRMSVKGLISYINVPSHKKKILYVCYAPTFNLVRQSMYLRRTGEFETILITETPWLNDFTEKYFDTVYVYDSNYALSNILNKAIPYIVHVLGSICNSEYFSVLARLLSKSLVVSEFYDVASLCVSKEDAGEIWGKANAELGFFSERFAYKWCDGIILGYSYEAMEILKNRYDIKIPMLEFHSYVCDKFTSGGNSKYSDVDGKIHIVYGGMVASSRFPEKFFGDTQFHRLIETITKQGIYFDIFLTPQYNALRVKQLFGDYMLMAKKNPLFNFKRGLSPDETHGEFSKYDFGAMIYLFDRGTLLEEHNRTRLPTKVFTYLEAGLPILISEEFQYVARLVKEHEIGIVISRKDLDNLPNVINSYDIGKLRANVKKAQKELSMDKHIGRLITFYEQVHRLALSRR
jgi:hypothetical protein